MFRSLVLLLTLSAATNVLAKDLPKFRKSSPSSIEVDASQCGPETPAVTDPYQKRAHVLYMMFLTTPANSIKDPEWALQSVTNQEFDSCASCYVAAATIMSAIKGTPTINAVGWCFAKETGTPPSPVGAERNFAPGEEPAPPTTSLGRALSFPFVKQVR